MTTGYLWTGQFEEVQSVLEDGKPQSMELDENSLNGHWATNAKNNIEFFIINDAIFTKLCILGDDVEPCFEGASITKPEVSSTFSKTVDENFKKTLFNMIQELQDALKGGNSMDIEEVKAPEEFVQEEASQPETESTLEPSEAEPESSFEESSEENTIDNLESSEEIVPEAVEVENEFEKKEEEEDKEESEEEESDEEKDDNEDEEDKKKYSLLEQQYNELSDQYNQLKADYDTLVEFKLGIENERKDALINEFYMLSDEDKKDVIENKSQYSLDEIKAKLAVICYEKKVNFSLDDSSEIDNNIEQDVTTFNFDSAASNDLPDWVKAVKNV